MDSHKYVSGCAVPFDVEELVTGVRLVVERNPVQFLTPHTHVTGFGDSQVLVLLVRSGDPNFSIDELAKVVGQSVDDWINKNSASGVKTIGSLTDAPDYSLQTDIRKAMEPKGPSRN